MQKLYSSKEAAEYLGITLSSLKYHIHTGKNLHPQLVGHSFIFTQEELDRFQTERRKQGRPRKAKD